MFLGGYEHNTDGKEIYHDTAMTLTMANRRPVVVHNLKFLKNGRAGAATVFYGGENWFRGTIQGILKGEASLCH
jgi:hypothetical protein